MKYTEVIGDLFTAPENYMLAHCISADFGMGAGIVVQFNKRYDMKNVLMKKYPNFLEQFKASGSKGAVIIEGRVFNLITKKRVWEKPTYESMQEALGAMKYVMVNCKLTHLAMPLIGCGIDGLSWDRVSEMVKETFKDTDIEIIVYRFE